MRITPNAPIVSRREAAGYYVVSNGTYEDDIKTDSQGQTLSVGEKLVVVTVVQFTKKHDDVDQDYWLASGSWGHGVTGEPVATKREAMKEAEALLNTRQQEVADWLRRIAAKKAQQK